MLGRGVIGGAALTASIVAAVGAVVAFADDNLGNAGDISYRSDSAVIGPPQTVVINVSCPGRKHVSGAGVGTVSTVPGPWNRSLPIDRGDRDRQPDDGWLVERTDDPGFPTGTAFAYAMCDSKARSYRSRTKRVRAGTSKTVRVKCTRSQHVSGGGAAQLGASFYGEIEDTYPFDGPDRGSKPDDGWAVTMSNADHQTRQVKAFAVCASANLTYRSRSAPLLGAGYLVPSPECGNRHLVGAGARISSPPDNSRLENLDPIDGIDSGSVPDDHARGDGSSDAGSGSMTVFGICR